MDSRHVEGGLPQTFSLFSAVSLGWLTVNVFGGMSFIVFVGLSAGGLPVILYGFIGSSIAVTCMVMTFAQCASRYSTAGGAYHYACFLTPEKYRRSVAYPLGWLNYLGWIFTHAACCAITGTCIMALVNLCNPGFDVSTRWQLFCVYLAVNLLCWLINLWRLKGIPKLEEIGCYLSVIGFVVYTIALLAKAPKASAEFVFVKTNNDTGYGSMPFAILLGLFNSFAVLMALDGPAHLAEEIPQPKKALPRILMIVIISQTVIGVIGILVIGFCMTDLQSVIESSTGVPVLELIRLATGSNAAAIAFCVLLIVNTAASALGAAVTMSRQGYAFARDGGLFWNAKLTKLSPGSHLPFWSINLPSFLVALIGLIYLFSDTAFNAIIGSQVVCMIISLVGSGTPALMLLITRGEALPKSSRWNFGIWSTPVYSISVVYALLVTVVAFMPQKHPIEVVNMNYTILVIGTFTIMIVLSWFLEGRKLFKPPVNGEDIVERIIDGVSLDEESQEHVDHTTSEGKSG